MARVPLLLAVAAHLGDGHAGHALCHERFLDLSTLSGRTIAFSSFISRSPENVRRRSLPVAIAQTGAIRKHRTPAAVPYMDAAGTTRHATTKADTREVV